MHDFPAGQYTPEGALELLKVRYQKLESDTSFFLNILHYKNKTFFSFILHILKAPYPFYFSQFSIIIHRYLFNGILNNAGKYRNKKEFNNGFVGFGGTNRRKFDSPKYIGFPPAEIEKGVLNACILLKKKDIKEDAVKSALEFYRRFVRIHPFYDGNGRIGRLMLSIYLQDHGLYVKWREIEEHKNEFIKKLNACHDRESDADKYSTYFGYLLNFFKKYIIRIDELENPHL